MSSNKTLPTGASVDEFIANVEPERRRNEAMALNEILQRITGCEPEMWGPSIVGYDRYQYTYESGRSGEFFVAGFSPRKTALTIYVMPGFSDYGDVLARLGKHKLGRSCLYLSSLAKVEMDVLEELVTASVAEMRARYPTESGS